LNRAYGFCDLVLSSPFTITTIISIEHPSHWITSYQNNYPNRQLNRSIKDTRSDNKVRELATMCLPWQQWTETQVYWFDDVCISAFHSFVVVDIWQSLSEWRLLLSECVLVCCENVVASIRAMNEH
jgi:hypothetical protein